MPPRQLKRAIDKAPATIRKLNAGQPVKRARSFKAWTVSQLLETYQDPRAVLLEIAGMDTHKLAEHIGCTPADALAERRLCAQAVLPYVAQKLPVQVDMLHTRAIHLNLVTDEQYTELVTIADTPTQDDANHVTLLQGQVIDDTDEPPTTAAGDTAHDAHVHAEQSDSTANGTAAANAPHTAEASDVEQRGFAFDELQHGEKGVAPSAPAPPTRAREQD